MILVARFKALDFHLGRLTVTTDLSLIAISLVLESLT